MDFDRYIHDYNINIDIDENSKKIITDILTYMKTTDLFFYNFFKNNYHLYNYDIKLFDVDRKSVARATRPPWPPNQRLR